MMNILSALSGQRSARTLDGGRWTLYFLLFLLALVLLPSLVLAQEETQTPEERVEPPLSLEEETQTPAERLEPPPSLEEAGPLSLEATGRVSWIVKYGLGDFRGLTERGYTDQLLLEQALSVDAEGGVQVEWPLSGIISIAAHLDNQQAENLQLLSIKYQGKDLQGEFGDFTVAGNTGFTGYDKKLKGLRINWTPQDELTLEGVFSRVEGIPQVRVFRGDTSPGEVTYTLRPLEERWAEQPYLKNIRGLEFYPITGFVPGFSKLELSFAAPQGLGELLGSYNLGYLFPLIREEPQTEMEQTRYVVANKGEEQFLLLKRETLELLRGTIKRYVDDYNEKNDLSDEERKEYPLGEGSDYELGFLKGLIAQYVSFNLDGTELRLDGYQRERFYYLGHPEIDPDSIEILVKRGEEDFTPITDPELIGYDYYLFADEGIIELDFPASFFANLEQNGVRVEFNYAISGGTYMLGLSIVRGSEKVYLNGKRLQRDLDYTIDYDSGMLLLFREVTPEDELRIEYETFRGGLGGVTDYKRNLSGLLLSYQATDYLTLAVDLLRAADSPAASDRSTLSTMPGDHMVGAFSTKLELGKLQGELEVGYNYNRFPFDDNQRRNRLNRINTIRAISYQGKRYVLFGTQNGLVVFDGQQWRSFGAAEGLAGSSVRDIAVGESVLAFATDSGLSLLRMEGEAPFAILPNWRRFYQQDGLSSQNLYAVLIQDGDLYLGTEEGLNLVPLEEVEDEESWESYQKETYSGMISDRILQLAGDGELVYLGTDQGLLIFGPREGTFTAADELRGVEIDDLFSVGAEVLAASQSGIRVFQRGKGSGWLPGPANVQAIASVAEQVWFGTEEGLYLMGQGKPLVEAQVTALFLADSGLWVGTKATADYELTIWLVEEDGSLYGYSQDETRIEGCDLHHFEDIPAAEHTDRGLAAVLSLSQDLGKLELTGTLKSISPQFTALGSQDRRDLRGWSLGAVYQVTPRVSIDLQHQADLEGAHREDKRYSEEESLELSWDFGPKLEAGYSLERIDNREDSGFDQVRHDLSATIGSSLLQDRLGLSLSYEQLSLVDLRWTKRTSQDGRLVAQADLRLLPGLEFTWRYRRPVKVTRYGERTRRWGSEELDFSVRWSQGFPLFSINASYNRGGHNRIPAEEGESETAQGGQVELQFDSLEFGELSLSPQGTLSFQHQGEAGREQLSLGGEGGLRGELGQFKAQTSYELSSTLDEWSERKEFVLNPSFRLDYGGWRSLSPRLTLNGTMRVLEHPSYGQKTLENWTASAGLGWKISHLSDNLSLSQSRVKNDNEDTTSYALRNVLDYRVPFLPKLSSSLETRGSYTWGERRGEPLDSLQGELVLKGDYKLGGNWGASGSVGYVVNLDNLDPEDSYQSLYFSAQVATTF